MAIPPLSHAYQFNQLQKDCAHFSTGRLKNYKAWIQTPSSARACDNPAISIGIQKRGLLAQLIHTLSPSSTLAKRNFRTHLEIVDLHIASILGACSEDADQPVNHELANILTAKDTLIRMTSALTGPTLTLSTLLQMRVHAQLHSMSIDQRAALLKGLDQVLASDTLLAQNPLIACIYYELVQPAIKKSGDHLNAPLQHAIDQATEVIRHENEYSKMLDSKHAKEIAPELSQDKDKLKSVQNDISKRLAEPCYDLLNGPKMAINRWLDTHYGHKLGETKTSAHGMALIAMTFANDLGQSHDDKHIQSITKLLRKLPNYDLAALRYSNLDVRGVPKQWQATFHNIIDNIITNRKKKHQEFNRNAQNFLNLCSNHLMNSNHRAYPVARSGADMLLSLAKKLQKNSMTLSDLLQEPVRTHLATITPEQRPVLTTNIMAFLNLKRIDNGQPLTIHDGPTLAENPVVQQIMYSLTLALLQDTLPALQNHLQHSMLNPQHTNSAVWNAAMDIAKTQLHTHGFSEPGTATSHPIGLIKGAMINLLDDERTAEGLSNILEQVPTDTLWVLLDVKPYLPLPATHEKLLEIKHNESVLEALINNAISMQNNQLDPASFFSTTVRGKNPPTH